VGTAAFGCPRSKLRLGLSRRLRCCWRGEPGFARRAAEGGCPHMNHETCIPVLPDTTPTQNETYVVNFVTTITVTNPAAGL